MIFRTAGAIATLFLGLGGQALAQYYPPAQSYPSQGYPRREPVLGVLLMIPVSSRADSAETH